MDEESWRQIMENAREDAAIRRKRIKVVGIKLSPRAAEHYGSRWLYAIEAD